MIYKKLYETLICYIGCINAMTKHQPVSDLDGRLLQMITHLVENHKVCEITKVLEEAA